MNLEHEKNVRRLARTESLLHWPVLVVVLHKLVALLIRYNGTFSFDAELNVFVSNLFKEDEVLDQLPLEVLLNL